MSHYKAAIDIGSNSILLLIVDQKNNEVCFESRITSLGKNLDKSRKFEEQSIQDSFNALNEYSQICLKYQIAFNQVRITATEASRVATNAEDFFAKVKTELDANIKLISGEEEARLSSQGALFNQLDYFKDKEILTLMDIGGGSTEIIRVQVEPFQIIDVVSLPLGSVRVSDWISEGTWETKKQEISASLNKEVFQTTSLIGVAGTMASLFHMIKDKKKFESTPLSQNHIKVDNLNQKFEKWTSHEDLSGFFLKEFHFLGKRSKVIHGGHEVCKFVCEQLGAKEIHVSMQGLVHGSILEITS